MIQVLLHLNDTLKEYVGHNYDQFSETDKKVRKYANSKHEYVDHYISDYLDNMAKLHILLGNDTLEIDTKLKSENDKIINSIEWKFCILNDGVEDDFPHTIYDVICLPNSFVNFNKKDRLRILLHEKMHIFQRIYPLETNILFVKYWGLNPFILPDHSATKSQMRFNPDNNVFQYSYYDPGSDSLCYNVQLYESAAKQLKDSRTKNLQISPTMYRRRPFSKNVTYWTILQRDDIKQNESPNEVMACLCTELVLNDHATPCSTTRTWMNMFL